jgi:hypothetical protein
VATSAGTKAGASRLLALSGAAGVAVIVVSIVALGGDTPNGDDSPGAIHRYYDAHELRQSAAAWVLALAAPLLAIFAAQLAARLGPGVDGSARRPWQTLLTAGGVAAGLGFLAAAFVHFALTEAANDGVTGGGLKALCELDANSWVSFNGGLGLLMLGAAGALLTVRRSFFAWSALVLGVALYIPFASFPALILSGVWLIATSVQLYRRGDAFSA